MLSLRSIVMARKVPRALMVQPHLKAGPGGDEVTTIHNDDDS